MKNNKFTDDIAYFISFCIESYKNAHALTGVQVSKIFHSTGLIDFLKENFDTIHTQSPHWIQEEIEEYLATAKSN